MPSSDIKAPVMKQVQLLEVESGDKKAKFLEKHLAFPKTIEDETEACEECGESLLKQYKRDLAKRKKFVEG